MQINPPRLSKLVDRMVWDGLVYRLIAQSDHRKINLLLTDLGRHRMLQIRKNVEDHDAVLIGKLDGKEQSVVIELLSKLSN